MDQRHKKKAPGKVTRVSRVSDDLRAAILHGNLSPGSKINLDQLRAQFDVSLSPLREAISRLLPGGLVEFEDQRGFRVTPITPEGLEEVTRLAADFQALAIRRAVAAAGLDWEGAVLAALHQVSRAVRDPEGDAEGARTSLYLALAQGSGMPMLVAACRTVGDHVERCRRLYPYAIAGRDMVSELRAIAEAAVRRDGDEAERLLRIEFARTGREIAEALDAESAPSNQRKRTGTRP